MSGKEFWIYLLIMSGSTYLIRAVPFAVIDKKIKNRFIQSFLYYIPYAVLTAMTIPAVFYATDSIISGVAGLLTAVVFAYLGQGLTTVAVASCLAVYVCEFFLI